MKYILFLDDERTIEMVDRSVWPEKTHILFATSSEWAKWIVREHGVPVFMSLDHDLGGDDTTMKFLHWLAEDWFYTSIPEYVVHSANPVGAANIVSFMDSWKRSQER